MDNKLSLDTIKRTAIESSGIIGSLYDEYRDCVLERLTIDSKDVFSKSEDYTDCQIIHGNADQCQNLLQMIDFEIDLRISILLNSAPRIGLAALIDHCHPVNEHTRFLCYTYIDRTEQLRSSATTEPANLHELYNSQKAATHIITNVSWGIKIVAVLQLPADAEKITDIDNLLGNVRAFMKGDSRDQIFSLQDEKLLEQLAHINVYSNIPALTKMTSVLAICQYINGRSIYFNMYHPLKYWLTPIRNVYPQCRWCDVHSVPFPIPLLLSNLEQYLLRSLDTVKRLKYSLDYTETNLLCGYLKERFEEMRLKWIHLNDQCKDQINQLKELFINVRCGNTDSVQIDQALQHHNQTTLNELSKTLNREVAELEAKGQLIVTLRRDNIGYCNVAELNVNENDYEQILFRETITNNKENVILCASDILNEKNPSMLAQLRDQLLKDRQTNQELHLIYADFSYCAFDLPNMMRLLLMKESNTAEQPKQDMCSLKTDEVVNILLLGKTGVGKSTFINAFVNYLTFDTLEHAQSNPPLVVIPVSFLITTGDNFQEHTVKFGDSDALHNEDFDHSGQSVTQHCKSYVFHLYQNGARKVRIIDTPGFGDTRGVEQDDRNIKYNTDQSILPSMS